MNDVVLTEVVQRYENLDRESFYQIEGESLEVVHLNEFIQVHTQHLEDDHQMLSEIELVDASNNVFLVIKVLVVQVLDQFSFNKALLIQPSLVLKDLESHILSCFVIVALQHHTKATFS